MLHMPGTKTYTCEVSLDATLEAMLSHEIGEPRTTQPTAAVTREDIHLKPWKYVGYKGYAKVVSLHDDLFILRRFGALSARIALRLQDKVVDLETRLGDLDALYSRKQIEDLDNGTFRGDLEDRSDLLEKIETALKQYNAFIIQQSSVRKMESASLRDADSLKTWHENHDFKAIESKEWQYLNEHDDLVRIVPKDKTRVRRLIDKSPYLRTLSFWKTLEEGIPEYDQSSISHYSDKRLDNFASGIIVVLGTTMLITPLWILQWLESSVSKLVVITIFNSVFLLVMSFLMVAKPFEALGATAAYAAVLMVFMQVGAGVS